MILFFFSCASTDLSFDISNNSPNEKDTQNIPAEPESTAEPSTETIDAPLTFYRDIRPILDESCNACHWESGRSFSMITHTYPLVWSSIIARDVVDGGKPPPTPNPTCREYIGGNWHLTDDDIQTIVDWVELDSPIGEPQDASPYTHWPSIGPFDEEYAPAETIQIPLSEGYRCYAFSITDKTALKALQMTTNNEEYIHHSLVYLSPSSSIPSNPADFACTYSGDSDWSLVAGWRPGAPPMELDGGIDLENDDYLVIQTYYTPPTEPDPEGNMEAPKFSWGALFSDSPDVRIVTTEIENFMLPAGSDNHSESGTLNWQGETAEVIGIMPRTHLLGTGVSASIQHDDGTTDCLMNQDGYDFGMPHNLIFSSPPTISNLDKINYQCTWDNSEGNMRQNFHPPIDVLSGSGRDDAICRMTLIVR